MWSRSLLFLSCVLWWSSFRAHQFKLRGQSKAIYYGVFLIALSVNVLTCAAIVNRTDLMPLIAGLLVIFIYRKTQSANAKLGSLAAFGTASILGVIGVFSAISFLRGRSNSRELLTSLMGYTLTSYNRLAAILHGSMHYTFGGKGIYLSSYLARENIFIPFVGVMREQLGWPTELQVWRSEFSSTAAAGMNPEFIWSGVFGYLYSDIGWWTLLYLLIAGVLAGYLWSGSALEVDIDDVVSLVSILGTLLARMESAIRHADDHNTRRRDSTCNI